MSFVAKLELWTNFTTPRHFKRLFFFHSFPCLKPPKYKGPPFEFMPGVTDGREGQNVTDMDWSDEPPRTPMPPPNQSRPVQTPGVWGVRGKAAPWALWSGVTVGGMTVTVAPSSTTRGGDPIRELSPGRPGPPSQLPNESGSVSQTQWAGGGVVPLRPSRGGKQRLLLWRGSSICTVEEWPARPSPSKGPL